MPVHSSVEDVDPTSLVVLSPSQSSLERLSTRIAADRLTTFIPPFSTMGFFDGPTRMVRSMLALLKPAKDDPDWADGTQVINVSYGQMYNCLCCRKGGITDLQHFTRCPSYIEHKRYCKSAYADWRARRRVARLNNRPFPEQFRPPHPGKYFDLSKKPLKENERMIAPTLVRAYPGEAGYGAYQTLCSTVAPSPKFFPSESSEAHDHLSYHSPFFTPDGKVIFPYAPDVVHPFPLGIYDAPGERTKRFDMIGRDEGEFMSTVIDSSAHPYGQSMYDPRFLNPPPAAFLPAAAAPMRAGFNSQFPPGSFQNLYGGQWAGSPPPGAPPQGGHWVSNVPSGETTFSGQPSVHDSQTSSVKEEVTTPQKKAAKKATKKGTKVKTPKGNRKGPPRGKPSGGPPSGSTRSKK
jgi:hypothetical protein